MSDKPKVELTAEELHTARLWYALCLSISKLGIKNPKNLGQPFPVQNLPGFSEFALSDLGKRVMASATGGETLFTSDFVKLIADPVREVLGVLR